ncbi:unnamed protein product [Urochloa humidicola]
MGCRSSRLDAAEVSPAATLCREHQNLLREVVDRRAHLATTHAAYFRALPGVADILARLASHHPRAHATATLRRPRRRRRRRRAQEAAERLRLRVQLSHTAHRLRPLHIHFHSDDDDGFNGRLRPPEAPPQSPFTAAAGCAPATAAECAPTVAAPPQRCGRRTSPSPGANWSSKVRRRLLLGELAPPTSPPVWGAWPAASSRSRQWPVPPRSGGMAPTSPPTMASHGA